MSISRLHAFPWPALVILSIAALTGCSRVGGDATQVAARVNDTELSLSQLQYVLQRQPRVAPERADAQARGTLEGIVEQELAAQAARKQGLDKLPRLVQSMEAAKREILAKAYQDVLAEKATLPTDEDVDKYYESQPALFAQRRFYSLQDVAVQASPEQLQAVHARLDAAPDAARVADVLREAHLRFSSKQLTVSPEDVPIGMLGKLANLREGNTLMVPQADGARMLTLLSSTAAPLNRDAARPMIMAFLANQRKRQAVMDGMKGIRETAHIEYKGRFAAAASQPAAGASAAAQ